MRDVKTLASVQTLNTRAEQQDLSEWQWWSKPIVGPGFVVDMQEFAVSNAGDPKEKHHAWKGNFQGRPGLLKELLPVLRIRYREASPSTIKIITTTLRHFWRYMDHEDDGLRIDQLLDIKDYHGVRFARWLMLNDGAGTRVSQISSLVNQAKELHKQPPVYWPEMLDKISEIRSVPEDAAVRKLYHALKADLRMRYKREEFCSIHVALSSLCLFLIHTGWNLETALSLDCREEGAWAIAHPLKEHIKVLRAPKSRAGGEMQHALSQVRPEFHAYQVVLKRLEFTHSLREKVLENLKRSAQTNKNLEEIENLRYILRSPWLYEYQGRIGRLVQDQSTLIAKHLGRLSVENQILDEQGKPMVFTSRNFRDAWIGFAYKQSGYQIMAAQAAAGHTSLKTTQGYLNRTRWRKEGQERLINLQKALWGEIQEGRAVDPAALSILVERGKISEEERNRLTDFRNRTRMGVGCRSPFNPPTEMRTADQKPGTLCEVQRCVLCPHALVFSDSLPGLARRKVELGIIAKRMALQAWTESSFPEEEEALDHILKRFESQAVKNCLVDWISKFEAGEEVLFDQEPIVEKSDE